MKPSNFERKARRKTQTRLTFDPLDHSSLPATMSPAKVRYQLPAGRSTPASSSQTVADGSNSVVGLSPNTPRRVTRILPPSSSRALPTPAKSSQIHNGGNAVNSDDELSRPNARPPTKGKTFLDSRKGLNSDAINIDDSDGSSPEDEEGLPARPLNKKMFKAPAKKTHRGASIQQKVSHQLPKATTQPSFGPKPARREYVELSSDSTSDDDILPSQKSKQTSKDMTASIASKQDSSEDDIMPTSQRRGRNRQRTAPLSDRLSNQAQSDSSDDLFSSPLKRRRVVTDSDDSDVVISPTKRRRNTRAEAQSQISDEDDLHSPKRASRQNSPVSTSPTRYTRQSKARKHRTEKQKTLELLKRRRAGEDIEALTESGSDTESMSDPERYQELSEFDDESEVEIMEETKKPSRKKKAQGEYDSDFVDDSDGDLGVPDLALLDIPLEFTHAAHKPLKEHFRDAIEWMVHNKMNPAFARDDPLYVQAFRKLDDEYGGYAKSKFVSSQWTADFTRAIYARPTLLERRLAPGEGVTVTGESKCDVCNHRNHLPTYHIQFEGKAYHKDSLEEVEQDSDDSGSGEDGEDSEARSRAGSVNAEGQPIPSEKTGWYSGRFCKANATQAHSLIHWKHSLNEWVVGNLEAEGYLTPEKLAEKERMKPKQKKALANSIVDKWGVDGHIKDLYHDFKLNLESAREAKQARFGGGQSMGSV